MTPNQLSAQTDFESARLAEESADCHADQVVTIGVGHFVHDTHTAFLMPLMPLIRDALDVGYTSAGGPTIFTQLPSLLNPFIGYLADRISVRYFVVLAPATTATLMCIIGFAPNYLSLVMLLTAVGVSIAAFHAPAPAMIARTSGNRVGAGMTIFMACGELGRTAGPIVVAAGVAWWGMQGIWRLAAFGWITSAALFFALHSAAGRPQVNKAMGLSAMWPATRRLYPVLAWIMGTKALMLVAIIYLPIIVRDALQAGLWPAAAALSILELAAVGVALLSGALSDRLVRNRVLVFVLSVAPVLLLLLQYGPSWLTAILFVALGLTAISPTPVIMAIMQHQFPDNRAVANVIWMAMSFLLGALANLIVGRLADSFGLAPAFTVAAFAGFLAVPGVYY